jgi:hypothetical protein
MLALNYCSYYQQSFTAVGYKIGIMNPPLSHAPSQIHKLKYIWQATMVLPQRTRSELLDDEYREKSNQTHRQEG